MIHNKKGLADIVTTALIILLVAVAVVAIWAFVGPALKGTGQQFNRAQVCIANIVDVTSCQAQTLDTTGGKYALKVQLRRTLSDGVVQLKSYKIDVVPGTGGTQVSKVREIASTNTNAKLQLASQGSTVSAYLLGVAPTTLPEDL